ELVDDPAGGVGESALRALVHLPLKPEAWQQVGPKVLAMLDEMETPSASAKAGSPKLDLEVLLQCAARVPVRQVRERVQVLAVSDDVETRRAAARALAGVRDPAAVPQLLDDLKGTETEARSAAIKDLVFVDTASLDRGAVKSLVRASRREPSPMDRFYAAVTLARAGWPHPLIRLLELGRSQGWIFLGAPPNRYFLRSLEPLPEKVKKRLSRFAQDDAPHDHARMIAESLLAPPLEPDEPTETPAPAPLDAAAVAEAERLAKAYLKGEIGEDWICRLRDDIDTLSSAPPGVAEELVAGIYRRIAEEVAGGEDPMMILVTAGNTAAELVSRLKFNFQPDLKDFLESYKQLSTSSPGVAEQLAWTVSRAKAPKILADLGAILPSTSAEDRVVLANLVEDAAVHASTDYPPMFGAGGESKEVPREIEFVDDGEPKERGPPSDIVPLSLAGGEPPRGPNRPPGDRDPPRRFYALLDGPDAVVSGQEFELQVGLSKLPTPGVGGGPMERPATSVGAYRLAVHVLADGFTLRQGESQRLVLPVTPDAPYPVETLHLRPDPQEERIKPRSISATYSIDGQTIGLGFRAVVVVRTADLLEQAPTEKQERGVDISAPVNEPPADLTLNIRRSESKYWVTLENAHDLPVPEEPYPIEIDDAREFARQLVQSINEKEGKPASYRHLLGKARTIADKLPNEFWRLLRDVTPLAAQQGRHPPSVLILSAEPFVPWELAAMKEPIDSEAPPFLAAQVDVGRWILAPGISATPPIRHSVENMSVVAGLYQDPKWSRLKQAEEEAKELETEYDAHFVDAKLISVLEAIEGKPRADLLHMAIHGKYDPGGLENGLVLIDGTLDPDTLKGSTMRRPLFVFLNACQVGTGDAVLSDYGGIAAAFLHLGAAAVIAPLWSIKDSHAQQIALNLYKGIHDPEQPNRPATLLRLERRKFKSAEPPVSSTFMAYQFFGHPALVLESRLKPREERP
ncbi:MAG: CHAT domain-containing protein, partial [Acidobacteria bacterium]|nr:CHAT domain-containing protein [Acidobacteriota bacterium]